MNKTNQQLQQLQVLQKYATKKGGEVLFPKKPQPFVCLSPPMSFFFTQKLLVTNLTIYVSISF